SEVVSSGLFAISAKNASGDTTLELVNIVVDTNAPFLLVDGLASPQRDATNGDFTVTGSTEPNTVVLSSLGQSTTSDANGRFTLQGSLSDGAATEDVLITATDLAGNTSTEGLTFARVASPNTALATGIPATGHNLPLWQLLLAAILLFLGLLCARSGRRAGRGTTG
ncbi:MAG: hypothetical protein LBP28_02620, partial [Coriobacteriales bacterium]|nr:hypothetical protein [Coriobacteriales bacterium]